MMELPIINEQDGERSISFKGWTISSLKRPISNSQQLDEISKTVQVNLPEILFGENFLKVKHEKTRWEYEFEALQALREVELGEGSASVKVAYAEEWERSRSNPALSTLESQSAKVQKPYDWTYSTTYSGKCTNTSPSSIQFQVPPLAHLGIPLASLANKSERILFYDDIPFFEDELGDNGSSYYSVKIRVMPTCFFILSRLFLRVDQVVFRIFDTRLYHQFGSNEIIKECRGREASYKTIKSYLERPADLSPLTDVNWVAQTLGMLEQTSPSTSSSSSSTSSSSTLRPFNSTTSSASSTFSPLRTTAPPPPSGAFGIPQRTPTVIPPSGVFPIPIQRVQTQDKGQDQERMQNEIPKLTKDIQQMNVKDSKDEPFKWKGLGTKLEVCLLN